jgi:hypothetical protein
MIVTRFFMPTDCGLSVFATDTVAIDDRAIAAIAMSDE